jgi:hypothetical protein
VDAGEIEMRDGRELTGAEQELRLGFRRAVAVPAKIRREAATTTGIIT